MLTIIVYVVEIIMDSNKPGSKRFDRVFKQNYL